MDKGHGTQAEATTTHPLEATPKSGEETEQGVFLILGGADFPGCSGSFARQSPRIHGWRSARSVNLDKRRDLGILSARTRNASFAGNHAPS